MQLILSSYLLGSCIIGGLAFSGIVFGLTFTHFVQSEPQSENITSSPSESETISDSNKNSTPSSISDKISETNQSNFSSSVSTPSISTTSQYAEPSKPSNLPSSIGWIRIGAIANPSGNTFIGEQLIKTKQDVTIYPSFVPAIGEKIKVIQSVNYRINYPQAPRYKLADKIGTFFPNQELVILNLKTFVDSTVSSSYTVVWAEVGLP
ncbi:hypothetical protein [Spirulina sp. 06S082]|uniref:hypothetical protein n=1 Tax=Spirulina sp. 06S082 TaxID=3110248 RepID=UPI002B1FB321|nr:hypothetical protein [Spirulina sp. 06S082]MEA5471271.1 hypothetical protein [Spirulina sp. 06S082]